MRGLGAALVAFALSAPPVAAESVGFYFAPPIGSKFVAREIQTIELRLGGNRELHTIAALSTVRIFKEAGLIFVAHRVDELAASKAGEKFETPPQVAAMKGSEIVDVLRDDGVLVRVDGYRQIAAKALPKMSGEARSSLEKFVAEGRQDDADRALWFEVEMLAGQTLDLDRDYWYDAVWSDEKGWMRHQTLMRLGPWVTHPTAGRLLTVNIAYVANARPDRSSDPALPEGEEPPRPIAARRHRPGPEAGGGRDLAGRSRDAHGVEDSEPAQGERAAADLLRPRRDPGHRDQDREDAGAGPVAGEELNMYRLEEGIR